MDGKDENGGANKLSLFPSKKIPRLALEFFYRELISLHENRLFCSIRKTFFMFVYPKQKWATDFSKGITIVFVSAWEKSKKCQFSLLRNYLLYLLGR